MTVLVTAIVIRFVSPAQTTDDLGKMAGAAYDSLAKSIVFYRNKFLFAGNDTVQIMNKDLDKNWKELLENMLKNTNAAFGESNNVGRFEAVNAKFQTLRDTKDTIPVQQRFIIGGIDVWLEMMSDVLDGKSDPEARTNPKFPFGILEANYKKRWPSSDGANLERFLEYQLTVNKERFFKGYSEQESLLIEADIDTFVKTEEQKTKLKGLLQEAKATLPVEAGPEAEKLKAEIENAKVSLAGGRKFKKMSLMQSYLDMFKYFDPDKFAQHVNAPQIGYVFVDFYHFLNLLRFKADFVITDPTRFVLNALEICLNHTAAFPTPTDNPFISSLCIYPHKSYSNVYFFVKLHAKGVSKSGEIVMSNYASNQPVTNVKSFFTMSLAFPEISKQLVTICSESVQERLIDFCGIYRMFNEFANTIADITQKKVSWVEWPESGGFKVLDLPARVTDYQRIHKLFEVNVKNSIIAKEKRGKVAILMALEAAYFQSGYNSDAFRVLGMYFINPKPSDASVVAAMENKHPGYVSFLSTFAEEDMQNLSNYLRLTHSATRLRPVEHAIADVINSILSINEKHMAKSSQLLSYFMAKEQVTVHHLKLFLNFANTASGYAKLADVTAIFLKTYSLAELMTPFNDQLYGEWAAKLAETDSRLKTDNGKQIYTPAVLGSTVLEAARKTLAELLQADYAQLVTILDATQPQESAKNGPDAFKIDSTDTNMMEATNDQPSVQISIKKASLKVTEKQDTFASKQMIIPVGKFTAEQLKRPPCTAELVMKKIACLNVPYREMFVQVTSKEVESTIEVQSFKLKINVVDKAQMAKFADQDVRRFTPVRVPATTVLTPENIKQAEVVLKAANFPEIRSWDKIMISVPSSIYEILGKKYVAADGSVKTVDGNALKVNLSSFKITKSAVQTVEETKEEMMYQKTSSLSLSQKRALQVHAKVSLLRI